MDTGPDAAGKAGNVALHHGDLVHDRPCVIAQAFAGSGELNAAATAPHQRHAQISLEPLDPGARRCESQMGAGRTMGDAS